MSKNQSIKSFFTSSAQNAQQQKKEETVMKKEPEKKVAPTEATETTTTSSNTPQKRQRKISSSSSSSGSPASAAAETTKEKKTTTKSSSPATKGAKPTKETKSESDVSVSEEKENKKDAKRQKTVASSSSSSSSSNTCNSSSAKKKTSPKKSSKAAVASDSDDSPLKSTESSSSNNKRRKLVLESSSSESDSISETPAVVEEKKKKKSPAPKKTAAQSKKAAKEEEETKKKQKSPIEEKESKPTKKINEEKKVEVKIEDGDKEEVKIEETVKQETTSKNNEMKLVNKPGKEEKNLISKSTSNFFGGKKAEKSVGLSNSSDQTGIGKDNYAPNKENYHPINDACWSKGSPVPYKALAQTLYCMERTTKRLELLSIVCNYFRSVLVLTPKDLIPSMYILTNKVAPDYDNIELGIGDTVLFKALAEATGSTLAKLKSDFQAKGDIGLVAESNRCNQRLIFTPKKLNVAGVFTKLKEIAAISGNSSQTKKCDLIKGLLVSCDAVEARYLMRSLAGKMRTGLGELSVLSAVAHACAITPPLKNEDEEVVIDTFAKLRKKDQLDDIKKKLDEHATMLKQAYYQCPNYDRVISAVIEHGLENLTDYCKVTPGVPLKPMLANPTKGVQEVLNRFENMVFTCEYKYDGERAQIHILEDGSLQIFSRNSENNTSKYPDVIESLQEILHLKEKASSEEEDEKSKRKVKTAILDAEVVAYDSENKNILPFQVLSTRKRKDASSADIKIKVCLFAFDLIYLNGESLIEKPFRKRRELLYEFFPYTESRLMFATNMNTNDLESIQEFLEKSVKDGCEGLMVKTLDEDAHYEISKRSRNWLKLKKDYLDGVGDTLDLVVIGGYLGTGKRTGVYGGYLLACYDAENEEYQTVCKIGTGFKDDDLQKQFESLTSAKISKPKSYYRVNESLEQPDHWFESVQVWEIKCADFSLSPVHTASIGLIDEGRGISMRFPRYLRTREDKKPEEATSSEQIADMYKNQQQMINQNNNNQDHKADDEEDY